MGFFGFGKKNKEKEQEKMKTGTGKDPHRFLGQYPQHPHRQRHRR